MHDKPPPSQFWWFILAVTALLIYGAVARYVGISTHIAIYNR